MAFFEIALRDLFSMTTKVTIYIVSVQVLLFQNETFSIFKMY